MKLPKPSTLAITIGVNLAAAATGYFVADALSHNTGVARASGIELPMASTLAGKAVIVLLPSSATPEDIAAAEKRCQCLVGVQDKKGLQ